LPVMIAYAVPKSRQFLPALSRSVASELDTVSILFCPGWLPHLSQACKFWTFCFLAG
jgi:hypothetical protein